MSHLNLVPGSSCQQPKVFTSHKQLNVEAMALSQTFNIAVIVDQLVVVFNLDSSLHEVTDSYLLELLNWVATGCYFAINYSKIIGFTKHFNTVVIDCCLLSYFIAIIDSAITDRRIHN